VYKRQGESYTACSKNVSSYYYATIPSPSAPRYIMATISGVDIDLYEFQIFNDDIIVAFGEDGSLYAKYLESTPIGETGSPEAVPIFNNSNNIISADAYVCVDYTGSEADEYIKISSSENGTYYGINDGAIIEDDKDSSTYRWSMGEFDNTTVSGDNIVLIDPTISGGVYTSPIFSLDNKYMASYFITDGTTESGVNSISYNENVYNGTIRVRSSDTELLDIDEVFWPHRDVNDKIYTAKKISYNDVEYDEFVHINTSSVIEPIGVGIDRRAGKIAVSLKHNQGTFKGGYLYIYDISGNLITSKFDIIAYRELRFDVNMEFDKWGGLWGYGAYDKSLIHTSDDLSDAYLYDFNDGSDFLYDLAVEMDGDGVWYTNKLDDIVIHKDYEGITLNTISLNEPRAICGTLDNGCWVVDDVDEKAYRYSSSAVLVKTVDIGRTAARMCTDMANGFWYILGNYIYHVTSDGIQDISINISKPTKIKGGYNGAIVWSENNNFVKYIDKDSGSVTRTFTISSSLIGFPSLFSFRHEDFVEFQNTNNLIPVSYDPVWGTGGSLNWKEVRKNGYFLPKTKYHQAEVTLRCEGSISPSLNKLIIPTAIKVQDIARQSSKNVYVKTFIPYGADIKDYETRLKTWWGINE